jgi:hypothetical protein
MANISALIGRPVTIRMNDFVDMPTYGHIQFIDSTKNSVAIKLDSPLEAGDIRYEWVVASARLQRDNLDTLINDKTLGCGVTWIPNTKFNINSPFDLSWWRGGAAAIADILLRHDPAAGEL